ncbi:putative uncharacterized protein [Firmicutes bacterium CAG:466]|jgi:DNA (cytosine-5)-methyltransferase 3A|nr:putative uncharacterized protein [Firmicutes bacterium CAG:466]
MIKLLIGGSPCTYWSVAQKKGREVEAKGLGWELFKNYLIAKEKFKPDLFLYENNKSAAQPIKDQISRELGVDLMYINSALVSAQNRQRFYAFNWCVDQPADRGIMLKDILESGFPFGDMIGKSFCLTSNYCKGSTAYQTLEHHKRTLAAEAIPLGMTQDGKSQCVRASCYKDGIRNLVGNNVDRRTCVAHPVRVGSMPNADGEITGGQAHRIYDASGKAVALCARANGGGPETGLYAYPAEEAQGMAWRGRGDGSAYEAREDGKANALTASGHQSRLVVTTANGKEMPVYEVINGEIEIKGKKYPIKLPDGFYIIRKLTPVECERLQTLPDGYTSAVSATQRYRGLGNGWTAEVIIHILMGALKDVPRDEEIVVLSMYDGIGTGRYCLDKMGFTNVTYYAYEIDKPAMTVALSNYPDIIQLGDAFDLRRDNWELGKRFDHEDASAAEPLQDDDQTTDLSSAPAEIKEAILKNDQALALREADPPENCVGAEEQPEPSETADIQCVTVVDILLDLRDERLRLSQINGKNRRYGDEVRALEYAIDILEAVT